MNLEIEEIVRLQKLMDDAVIRQHISDQIFIRIINESLAGRPVAFEDAMFAIVEESRHDGD